MGGEGMPRRGLAEIGADMQILAWIGIIFGIIFMSALVFAANKRESMGQRMLWVCGGGLLVGFVSMLTIPGIMERRFLDHTMPPGMRQLLKDMGR